MCVFKAIGQYSDFQLINNRQYDCSFRNGEFSSSDPKIEYCKSGRD